MEGLEQTRYTSPEDKGSVPEKCLFVSNLDSYCFIHIFRPINQNESFLWSIKVQNCKYKKSIPCQSLHTQHWQISPLENTYITKHTILTILCQFTCRKWCYGTKIWRAFIPLSLFYEKMWHYCIAMSVYLYSSNSFNKIINIGMKSRPLQHWNFNFWHQ